MESKAFFKPGSLVFALLVGALLGIPSTGLGGPSTVIVVEPGTIDLTVTRGSPVPFEIEITAPEGAEVSWQANESLSWLDLDSTTGTTPGTISGSFIPGSMPTGEHAGALTISGGGHDVPLPVNMQLIAMDLSMLKGDPARPYAYGLHPGSGNADDAFLIFYNTSTEQVENAIPIGQNPTDMTINHAEGRLYVTNWGQPVTRVVDLDTQTELSPLQLGTDVYKINAAGEGTIYYEEEDQWVEVFEVDTSNGVTSSALGSREGDAEIDPTGSYYYHCDNNISNAALHRYDMTGDSFVQISESPAHPYGTRNLVMSSDGSRIFWNTYVYNAELTELLRLPSEIYASAAEGRLAFTSTQAYHSGSGRLEYDLPFETTVMTESGDSSKMLLFDPVSQQIVAIPMSQIADIPGPSPFDGQQIEASDLATLSWSPRPGAASYRIYLDEDYDLIASSLPSVLIGTSSDNSLPLSSSLPFGQTYYWRADTVLPGGGIEHGPIWSFSINYPQVTFGVRPDGRSRDYMGSSVAISDRIGVIGIPEGDPEERSRAGYAQIFERNPGSDTWERSTLISMPQPVRDGYFGRAVAANENYIAVTAPGAHDAQGAVFIYAKQGAAWRHIHTIEPPRADVGGFGEYLQMDAQSLIISAPTTDYVRPGGSTNDRSGVLFVFQVGSWEQLAELANPEPAANAYMGRDFAFAGDILLVNVPQERTVHVFERSPTNGSWSHFQKITSPAGASTQFGVSLAADGNYLVIADVPWSAGPGRVYAYERGANNLWENTVTLTSGEAGQDEYGSSLALNNGRLFVGAPSLASASDNGRIFSYRPVPVPGYRTEWLPLASAMQTSPTGGAGIGLNMATSGDFLVTGLPLYNHAGTSNTGAAAFYQIGTSGNIAPVIISNPYPEASIGVPYTYEITALDENDGDTTTIGLALAPPWLSLVQGSGDHMLLTGTPPQGSAGDHTISLTVHDQAGRSSAQVFTLTVHANAQPPSVTSFSGDTTVYEHQNVALSVEGNGTGLLLYQWFRDGEAIDGATDQHLRLDPVTPADAGIYHVELRNAAGTTTSENLTLTVSSDERIGGDWATFGKRPDHSGYYPATLRSHRFLPAWSTPVMPGSGLRQAAVGQGQVYVTTRSRVNSTSPATALDLTDGSVVWSYPFPVAYSVNPPTYYNGRVFIQRGNHGSDTQLWCLDAATGSPLWSSPHGAQWENYYAPAVNENGIFINGGGYGGMYGFDHDGEQLFFQNMAQYDLWTPAISTDGRLFSWVAGIFSEHDPVNGETIWSHSSDWDWSGWSMGTVAAISGSRAVVFSTTHLQSYDIDARTMTWQLEGRFRGSPSVADGTIYAIQETAVRTFSLEDGSSLGDYDAGAGNTLRGDSQPMLLNDVIIVPSADKTFIFDRATRALLQTLPLGGPITYSDGYLLIAGDDGTLSAYYANRTPRVTGDPAPTIDEDQPYTATLNLEDDDGELINAEFLSLPPFLSFSRDGDIITLTGTPLAQHVGHHLIRVRITDSSGLSSTRDLPLEAIFVDDRPTTTGITETVAAEDSERQSVDLRAFFNDEEDGSTGLNYSIIQTGAALRSTDAGILTNPSIDDGMLSFELVGDAFGISGYRIAAADRAGQSVEADYKITVTPVDDRPKSEPIEPISAGGAAAAASHPLAGYFSDADPGDVLRYTITGNTNPAIFSSVSIDPDSGELSLAFTPYVSGASVLTIRATDSTGLEVETPLLVSLPAIPQPGLGVSSTIAINRQTGLHEHHIVVTNTGGRPIGGFQITVGGLPADAIVYNASDAPAPGEWTVTHAMALGAGESVDVMVEYHITSRRTGFEPTLSVAHTLPIDTTASPVAPGAAFSIDRMIAMEDGSMLIEFSSTPGRFYQVQYSRDGKTWHDSLARIRAAGTRVQWIDAGSPRTPSPPLQSGGRFYRVIENIGD